MTQMLRKEVRECLNNFALEIRLKEKELIPMLREEKMKTAKIFQ